MEEEWCDVQDMVEINISSRSVKIKLSQFTKIDFFYTYC